MARTSKELRKALRDQGCKPEVIDKIIDLYMGSSQKKKLPWKNG
jgi:SOS response regulatory protein OraA/RecX